VDGLWTYHALGFRTAWPRSRRPYLVFPHGMLDPWFRRAYPLRHLKKSLYWPCNEYRLLRDAHAVCFTAEEERWRALGCFRPYRLRSRIVSLGTPAPPPASDAQASAFAEACPAAAGKRVLLFLARVDPKKGCDLLLRAFARQARGHDELHLVMAGPDLAHRQRDYTVLARELGIADQVSWPGMLAGDAKWGALHAAEAMCLTSHQENFGVGLVEAMACGTPVLLSDQIAIWREPVAAGAGFAAPDNEAGANRVLARWLALNADQRAAMADAARDLFAERYRIEAATQGLLALLAEAAG
ncbi:MAG: glycosyltransferase, partial [Planctomycetota bacterium]